MALISINGAALPAPSKFKVIQSDIDGSDSGRSESGKMNRNRVRQGVYKIEYEAKNITQVQLATILSATTPSSFPVSFSHGSTKSATMYAGEKNTELVFIDDDGKTYWNISLSLVEM